MHLLGVDNYLETEQGQGACRLMRGPGLKGEHRPQLGKAPAAPTGSGPGSSGRASQVLESRALSSAFTAFLWPSGSSKAPPELWASGSSPDVGEITPGPRRPAGCSEMKQISVTKESIPGRRTRSGGPVNPGIQLPRCHRSHVLLARCGSWDQEVSPALIPSLPVTQAPSARQGLRGGPALWTGSREQ